MLSDEIIFNFSTAFPITFSAVSAMFKVLGWYLNLAVPPAAMIRDFISDEFS